jgi:hypothetical protein
VTGVVRDRGSSLVQGLPFAGPGFLSTILYIYACLLNFSFLCKVRYATTTTRNF